MSKLQELITLHRKYNCRLALSEFEKVSAPAPEHYLGLLNLDAASFTQFSLSPIQEDATTVVFRMFDRVSAPELIPSVLEKVVRVYIREQNLQEEELLLLYIEVMFSLTFQLFTSYYVTVHTDTACVRRSKTNWETQFLPPATRVRVSNSGRSSGLDTGPFTLCPCFCLRSPCSA